jgi:hypothetical protein
MELILGWRKRWSMHLDAAGQNAYILLNNSKQAG